MISFKTWKPTSFHSTKSEGQIMFQDALVNGLTVSSWSPRSTASLLMPSLECQSKRPTLLDIFPRPTGSTRPNVAPSLHRSDTLTTSFLPGATTHRTPPLLAMKRWERLVHLELSERCASHPLSEQAYERVRMKCKDCGTVHREIFPLIKVHQGHRIAYEQIVECVEKWGKFIKVISEEM